VINESTAKQLQKMTVEDVAKWGSKMHGFMVYQLVS
jgi:hypothetical protein